MNRSTFLAAAAAAATAARPAGAQELTPLDVAYAGSMGSMMEGPVKAGVARALRIEMHGRAQGSDALAQLIAGGSIAPDVFVPVTPGPVRTVLTAGKVRLATPIARTEMVIAYSPKSKYAAEFAAAAGHRRGAPPWYEILQRPDLRFGRSDPLTDPLGRNTIFMLQLAEAYYNRPGIAARVTGEALNPAQIFSPTTLEARLQSGELDAVASYKIQPVPFGLPYVALPEEINLGNQTLADRYARATLELRGRTYHPDPLVYYAAVLTATPRAAAANAFVGWLTGREGRDVLHRFAYDPPTGATTLRA